MGLSSQYNCWSFRCSWSITCRRCSNYIFIFDLIPGFNILHKDYNMRRETFKFWNLVRFILEIWWYFTWNITVTSSHEGHGLFYISFWFKSLHSYLNASWTLQQNKSHRNQAQIYKVHENHNVHLLLKFYGIIWLVKLIAEQLLIAKFSPQSRICEHVAGHVFLKCYLPLDKLRVEH